MANFQTGMNPDLESELMEAFQLIDKNNDGYITADDLNSTCRTLGMGLSAAEVEKGVDVLSLRSKPLITVADFIKIIGRTLSSRRGEEYLSQIFRFFDRSDTGKINAEELASRLSAVVRPTTVEEANLILDNVDRDGDRKISSDEFSSIMRSGFRENQ
ncbi:unnamed protein product [Calicophoron daubneyi]|uniref:EF-hand domain-containing protein n=1 Tax=Calicophoron daubneyi TaxID=300641 RepID=A0AAV2SY36_CALDB